MYEFHYDYIKNKYDNKSKLLFTDTDSLMYEIKTEDVYEDFSSDKEMFDFGNSSTKSKYYDDSNKFVLWLKDWLGTKLFSGSNFLESNFPGRTETSSRSQL